MQINEVALGLNWLVASHLGFIVDVEKRYAAVIGVPRVICDLLMPSGSKRSRLVGIELVSQLIRSIDELADDVFLLHVGEELILGDDLAFALLEMIDHMGCSEERSVTARTLDILLGWMALSNVDQRSLCSKFHIAKTHLRPMPLSTCSTIELLPTELADDVARRVLSLSVNERSHCGDFVFCQVLPVFAGKVAALAVVVIFSTLHMHFEVVLTIVAVQTQFVVARVLSILAAFSRMFARAANDCLEGHNVVR